MEKNNEETLMKSRSVGSAVTEGFRLYLDHFKRIFRFSWLGGLVYAVVSGIINTYFVMEFPRMSLLGLTTPADTSSQLRMLSELLPLLLMIPLVMVAMIFFSSYGFSVLRRHLATGTIPYPQKLINFDGPTLWRTVKCYLCMLVVSLVFMVVVAVFSALAAWGLGGVTGIVLMVLIEIVAIVLTLPLWYVSMRYMLTDGTGFWSLLGHGYSVGLRHLGYIFAVEMVEIAAVVLVNFVVSVPSFVLMSANMLAQAGAVNGDPLGMPPFMGTLTLVIFILAGFLSAYILLSILFPSYYMYGSIEQQEAEKQEVKDKLLKQ